MTQCNDNCASPTLLDIGVDVDTFTIPYNDQEILSLQDGLSVMSSVSWAWESGEGGIVDDVEMADQSPDPSLLPRFRA